MHTDLIGPFPTRSLGGAHYVVTYYDDNTGYGEAFPVAHKNNALHTLKRFRARVLKHFHTDIGTIRCDGAKELTIGQYGEYCVDNHIVVDAVAAYSPTTNGRIERYNGTLERMTKAMLLDSALPPALWAEAIQAAAFIRNRMFNSATKCIPYEALYGTLPPLHRLRAFGCRVWSHIDDNLRHKMDPVADRGILVGYDAKSYRVYLPHKHKIIRRRHCRFVEQLFPARLKAPAVSHPDLLPSQNLNIDSLTHSPSLSRASSVPAHVSDVLPATGRPADRPRRNHRLPAHLKDYALFASADAFATACAAELRPPEPTTLTEALRSNSEGKHWMAAARAEYESLIKRGTWTIVRMPAGAKSIKSRWTFKRKLGKNNEVVRYKGRFCAKGYSQQHGIDYNDVFAPVVRWDALRTMIAIAASLNITLYQLDVDNAFLYGDLSETIYMDQPPGFEIGDPRIMKCLLNKALYGLKQSSRVFNQSLDIKAPRHGLQADRS